jgi:hypothetical protein
VPLLWQARLFKRRGADPYPVHRPPLATACKGQERPAVPGIWKQGSEGMKYKIWIHIEQHEDGTDDYEDVGIPEQVIELDTAEEGHAFVSALVCFGQTYLAKHPYY